MDTARVRNFLTLGALHLSPDTAVVRKFRDFAVKPIQKLPILCPFKFMNRERQNWLIYVNINLNNRTSWPVFDLSGYVNDQPRYLIQDWHELHNPAAQYKPNCQQLQIDWC
jgi:hypothetical protein